MAAVEELLESPGVIRVLTDADREYYTCQDVMRLYGVKKSKAYTIIRELQKECIKEGKLSPCIPSGRIPKKIFRKKMGLG